MSNVSSKFVPKLSIGKVCKISQKCTVSIFIQRCIFLDKNYLSVDFLSWIPVLKQKHILTLFILLTTFNQSFRIVSQFNLYQSDTVRNWNKLLLFNIALRDPHTNLDRSKIYLLFFFKFKKMY